MPFRTFLHRRGITKMAQKEMNCCIQITDFYTIITDRVLNEMRIP